MFTCECVPEYCLVVEDKRGSLKYIISNLSYRCCSLVYLQTDRINDRFSNRVLSPPAVVASRFPRVAVGQWSGALKDISACTLYRSKNFRLANLTAGVSVTGFGARRLSLEVSGAVGLAS